jgi:hypothetical protein
MSLIAAAAVLALGHAQIDPNAITWRTNKTGSYSKAEDERIIVMDTLADYQQYIIKYAPEGAGDSRDINWNKEELVAIHVGTRNRGGYSVEVSSITKVKPNEARVFWSELTPPRGLATTQAITSPWTIVRLNRPGLRLSFEGRKEEGRLPGGIKIINLPGSDDGCRCCNKCVKAFENWLPWQPIATGDDCSVLVPSTLVMSSRDDYLNSLRNYKMQDLGAAAEIDWYRERLVAIHLGRKHYGGYQIRVDKVQMISNRTDVTYTQIEPTGIRELSAYSSTGPYLIVKVPRVGAVVTMNKRVGVDCQGPYDPCGCSCDSCRH